MTKRGGQSDEPYDDPDHRSPGAAVRRRGLVLAEPEMKPRGTWVAARQPMCKLLFRHLGSFRESLDDGMVAHLEKHGKSGGHALRAAVLGARDGLVSNFTLVVGVAGGNLPAKTILLTGLASLLAGRGHRVALGGRGSWRRKPTSGGSVAIASCGCSKQCWMNKRHRARM